MKAQSVRSWMQENPVPGIYLVTFSDNPHNILEIIPAVTLFQKTAARLCPEIVGMAKGMDEAMELVQMIVQTVYEETGDVLVEKYLKKAGEGMLHILWMLIKLILILLGTVLGLAVLVLLLLLFCPVRYSAEALKETSSFKETEAAVRVSWLFGGISFTFRRIQGKKYSETLRFWDSGSEPSPKTETEKGHCRESANGREKPFV